MVDLIGSDGSGFQFDLAKRNQFLEKSGFKKPTDRTTGTTLAGAVFKDGVVLGSDTRATAGDIVASKNCIKIVEIAPNIYCAGAGTAADCDQVGGMVSSALTLHRHDTGRETRVVTAMTILKTHLARYQGYVGAALIIGGVDLHGAHMFTIYPHGSVDSLPYGTMGSGSVCAMGVLESGFKDDMTKEEAMALVARAIKSGINNDNASGSNVDLAVITKGNVDFHRPYEHLQTKSYTAEKPISFPKGTAPVLKEVTVSLSDVVIEDGDAMDTT